MEESRGDEMTGGKMTGVLRWMWVDMDMQGNWDLVLWIWIAVSAQMYLRGPCTQFTSVKVLEVR